LNRTKQRRHQRTRTHFQPGTGLPERGDGDYPGKRYLDWELADPAGQSVADVRPIRDDIESRVRTLLTELGVPVDDQGSGRAALAPPAP
ncbi:MAG: hypothetical protein WCF04_03395, partial [Candidatus Nanopelagicales bacterium]